MMDFIGGVRFEINFVREYFYGLVRGVISRGFADVFGGGFGKVSVF
jgi:hypothetical protein